jgi:hypothetical protein
MSVVIQQALTPKVDALVKVAKEKFLSEFDDVAQSSAFAPGTFNFRRTFKLNFNHENTK